MYVVYEVLSTEKLCPDLRTSVFRGQEMKENWWLSQKYNLDYVVPKRKT